MKQFEIWWAALPGSAGTRPVLLLSRNSAYTYLNKFIAAEITTTIRNIPVEIPLGKAAGLEKKCVANFDNLRTVPRSALTTQAGVLPHARYSDAKRALGYALGWDELIHLQE